MRVVSTIAAAALLGLAGPATAAAQDHAHHAGAPEALGSVHFATSCRPEVAPRFDRGVALLHSFEFSAAITAFQGVLAADSSCAMAWWGIALARWTNPVAAGNRPPALLAQGRQAVDAARGLESGASARERGYVAAVATLYDDFEHRNQAERVLAYERAMAEVVAQAPADTEAKIFHALALVAAAPPADKSYANQLEAGRILEELWRAQPDHPGLAHYVIHAYDVPALAPRAAAAARRYAEIAPASAHALHMPSHTFTRLGLWEASVATNRRAIEAAARDSSPAEVLHSSDYMEYAYLQLGQYARARDVLESVPTVAAHFDPTVVRGAAPGSAGVFALAAIPARYALERGAWAEAAALRPASTTFPWADGLTWFARGLGAARLRDTLAARVAADSLGAIQRRMTSGEPYWAEQVAIQRLGVEAWLEHARGRDEQALAHMREAARREDATEKNAVTPGPLAPARELLGDLLMELKRPSDALAEYRRTLTREPGRRRALEGVRRARATPAARAAPSR